MRLKKYLVNDMSEAIPLIRADLGPDAIILHTEKVRSGLLGLLRRPRLQVMAAIDTDLRDFPQPMPAVDNTIQAMQQELTALKTTLAQVNQTRHTSEKIEYAVNLDNWYRRLLDEGVSVPLARQIVSTVSEELSHWAIDNPNILNEHLRWQLGRRLPVSASLPTSSNRGQVFFIVGPTGVGKTTTLAKLAATFAQTSRVKLITTDTFRVGAILQITTFAEVLGIPVEVAYTPQQLALLVEQNRSHQDLILIDTPGRSPRANKQIADLSDYLAAVPDKTVHLALSAGAKNEDMQQAVDTFSEMSLDGLIFTKIDETVSLGAAFSLACQTGLPINYITTGQCVPEDIKAAPNEDIINLLLSSKACLPKNNSPITKLTSPHFSGSGLYELQPQFVSG
ncbi:MAG TPA: 50S ribosome-binding GTPase [Anaerolineae bacterium]|nr:50S ribosome-binding GTPase [Anaerolineae bacterium]HRV90570.1 50S ribosome-binding GTPase [Anaerolineae bacterium]